MAVGGFPEGFRWGTATAAHQVEGNNVNNDWWDWEHDPSSPCQEPSGDACDQYHRYEEDLRLLADLGFDSYRFSVEWSRIEPADGELSIAALDHYARVCDAARAAGLAPVVTFHHFTTPRWLAARGGWAEPATADRFARFCERTARHLGPDRIDTACTINEPNIVAVCGFRLGVFPPGETDDGRWADSRAVLCRAHRSAVDALKSELGSVPVGMTLSMTEHVAVDGADEQVAEHRQLMEDEFLDACRGDDFIGVQTYSRTRIGPDGLLGPEPGVDVLAMGYEYWPQALEATIRRAWTYLGEEVPVLVTENGIGTDDDDQRIRYVRTALEGVLACLAAGIDVRGYTYWSLLDNFEWAYGYRMRFGLVDVDRDTFVRTPKPSAAWLSEIVRGNRLIGAS